MEAAVAQLGHLLQPGRIRPAPNADHRHGDALRRQLSNQLRHALLLFGVGAVGQDDDVAHLVGAAVQRLGRRRQAGVNVDAAAARAQPPHLLDGLVPVGGRHRADDRVRGLINGDKGHLVVLVQQLQRPHRPLGRQLNLRDPVFFGRHAT